MQFGATVSIVAIPEVVVVGAGPTGLMLACELALGGVKPRLLEERADMPNITRAFAVHARTLELLDARGLADELIPRGMPVYEIAPAPGATLDLRELPTRFGMVAHRSRKAARSRYGGPRQALGVEFVRAPR
jgi:2-polyprenyl-6-methoxyphenol hydroxylase-like FAD-dependent oxidoreductase